MRLKTIRAALCALAMLAALIVGVPAFADEMSALKRAEAAQVKDPRDTLSVMAAVTPPGMAVPTEAQVRITLANGATSAISDVCIMDSEGILIEEIGDLSGSGRSSETFEERLTPTEKQLKAEGIEYQVYYTLDKGLETELRRKITVLAPITRLQSEPSLEFTRTPSANFARQGEGVSITYRLRNTGNVPLTDVRLSDPLCGEVGTLDALDPGKKKTFTINAVVEQNVESQPSVSYTYPGYEDRVTKKLDPITIYKADERLDALLDADAVSVLPGSVVKLRLKISNLGNVTYDRLEISDEALGALGPVLVELKPGEDYWFVKDVNIKSTTTFMFTILARSATGSPANAASNMLTVAVTPPLGSIKLNLSAGADAPTLDGPGPVNITLNIQNNGEMDVRNVALSERNRGEVKSLAVVAVGETSVPVEYTIDQTETFQFMATLRDAEGSVTTVFFPPLTIEVRPEAASPGSSRAPDPSEALNISDNAYRMDGADEGTYRRMILTALLLLGLLLLALLISTAVRYSRRRKQKRLLARKLRKGSARGLDSSLSGTLARGADSNTGVYKKSDIAVRREGT